MWHVGQIFARHADQIRMVIVSDRHQYVMRLPHTLDAV